MRYRAALALALIPVLVAAVAVRWSSGARAQEPPGVAVPPIPPRTPIPTVTPPNPAVRLDRMSVLADIDESVARTTVELVFTNAGDRAGEATLLFPLPYGAAVTDLTLTNLGQTIEGEILGRDDAARIYTGIVQRQRDPALLEYVGLGLVRARVFPVPPHDESRLTLRFSQVLVPEAGRTRYRLPLSSGTEQLAPLSSLSVRVRVSSARGVRSIFSPTHDMRVTRESETAATAAYEATNVVPRGVLELDALLSGDQVGAGLLTYRTGDDDGFFMLWLTPPLRQEAVVAKDVILVLDISGSMQGRKLDQAKAALRFVLGALNQDDRFGIVAFSSDVESYSSGLLPASEAGAARAYVDRLEAGGGTNIDGALSAAMSSADPSRLTTVIFLTDGDPTVGETNPARILERVRGRAPAGVRLFVFGVGDDVNTVLLDGLAVQNHGDVSYVRPSEDVESTVSALYGRVGSPQLTDIALDFGSVRTADMYPSPLPDLFGGQPLFIVGRYRTTGTTDVTLTGQARDGSQRFTFASMRFPDSDRSASYLPRLWAQRKVGSLLREIALRGPAASRELIDEVTVLGRRYGIVTPYTSFLAIEPGAQPPPTVRPAPVAAPATGSAAVSAAAQAGTLAGSGPAATATRVATPTAAPAAPPIRAATATATPGSGSTTAAPSSPSGGAEVRTVGDKAFALQGGVWTDTAYTKGTDTVKVQFASDAYFELLGRIPDLAPVFALGERVIVVWEGMAYEVTS